MGGEGGERRARIAKCLRPAQLPYKDSEGRERTSMGTIVVTITARACEGARGLSLHVYKMFCRAPLRLAG